MQHLTDEQRDQWQNNGYLHLEQVLDSNQVAFFNAELERIRRVPGYEPDRNPDLPIGHYKWLDHAVSLENGGFMDRRDLLQYHQSFIDLLDQPSFFDYIVDLMGHNILLSMTQAIVRPATEKFPGYTHTDGGESLRMTRVDKTSPPIAMKAMFLLTDVTEKDCGNLTIFPGSHVKQIPDHVDEQITTPYSEGARQLMGKAGDVYLFTHSLWHGPAKNLHGNSRRVLLYNYCQMWVRSYDHDRIPGLASQCTPRQRRLLGDLGYDFRPGSYFYVPRDQADIMHNR